MKNIIKLSSIVMAGVMLISCVPFMQASAKTTNTPKKILVYKNNDKGIRLRWEKTDKAKKYTVYRSQQEKKGFKSIATTKWPSFTDEKAKAGKTYYYKIKASTGANYQVKKIVRLKAPTLKKPVLGKDNMVELKWNKVKGAASYGIYRAKVIEGKPDKYNYIFTTRNNKFLDEITFAGTYKYKIKAENGYSESVASNNTVINYEEPMDTPTVIALPTEDHKGIKILYTRAADIEGYRIYRSINSGGYFKLIDDIKAEETEPAEGFLDDMGVSQYIDTNVVYEKSYLYAIEVYYGDKTSGKIHAYSEVEFDVADIVVDEGKTSGVLKRRLKSIDYLLGDGAYEDLLEIIDVSYVMENPEVASIDEIGVITGISQGTTIATITYTAKIEGLTITMQEKVHVAVNTPSN